MAIPWYEWRNIRERLITFGRAIQGISPYRVRIEPDTTKCPTGYCDFSKREIAINPGIFPLMPKEQYQLTKAILVHEAGHRRFTTTRKLPPVVHMVSNILEDERIERLMSDEFAGLRSLIKKLSEQLYKEAKLVNEVSDSPGEIVNYFLQLRWAKRIKQPVKGKLSAACEKLWGKVETLVYESWGAENSEVVDNNAEQIVRILGLKEYQIPEWIKDILDKLGSVEGKRSSGDRAESGGISCDDSSNASHDGSDPFDGEVPPNDNSLGNGHQSIEPVPYIWLEEWVRPLVQELIEELSLEDIPNQQEPAERGGRFSVRAYLRDKSHPFLAEREQRKAPPTLALKVVIDHSTSLNHSYGDKTRIESIAEAIMTLHLVCLELEIPHEILVTPQAVKIADLDSGERGKALIAGLVPARCGYENMGLALKTYAMPLVERSEDIKLVLCLTDGACNDAKLGKEICQILRGKVEIIGILLDPDKDTREYVTDMFGLDRVIACCSTELPQKIGNVLRTVMRV